MSRPDYIPDGYTEEFSIAAVTEGENQHGELSGLFRPCYGPDRDRVTDAYQKSRHDFTSSLCDLLPKYVTSWSLRDAAGKEVRINRAAMESLNPSQREKLADIVFYNAPAKTEAALKN